MRFNIQPISQNGEVNLSARSDDEATIYGSCVGRYSPKKREITVERFYVQDGFSGRRIEVALFSVLRVLAERQLHGGVSVTLEPAIPEDVAKAINDILKKAKFMH